LFKQKTPKSKEQREKREQREEEREKFSEEMRGEREIFGTKSSWYGGVRPEKY
jgi:hypothetical protein